MKSFEDIKNMWKQQQKQPQKDAATVMVKAKKDQFVLRRRMTFESLALVAVVGILFGVMVLVDFTMNSSYIGLWLMIFCIVVFLIIKLIQLFWLKNIDLSGPPAHVLKQLERYYEFQKKVNTKGVMIYSAVLNIAFAFYFIETLQHLSTWAKIAALIVYSGWMLFAVFVLGKKQAKNEHAKMESIIRTIKEREEGLEEV